MSNASLLKRIEENFDSLQKSEKKVAQYLVENANRRLDGSISELAERLETSVATISRLCRKLKYDNFQDLKLSIAEQATLGAGQFVKNVPENINLSDNAGTLAQKLLSSQIVALEKTFDLFDSEVFETVVADILQADRVLFVGVGGGYAMCVEAVHLFMKIGINCSAHSDGYTQLISSAMSSGSTFVVGISFTGTTPTVANTLAVSGKLGANTLAITSNPISPVAKSAKHCILSSVTASQITPLYGDFLEGRMAQLYIINILFLMVVIRNFDDAEASLEKTSNILNEYYLSR
jgi:RpiR family carbohydrate utilization transcriptional regulator